MGQTNLTEILDSLQPSFRKLFGIKMTENGKKLA
jgi:hypothetical protein